MPMIEVPVVPNSPIWKLCPKCNDEQLKIERPCNKCAWAACGIWSCASIFPHKTPSPDGSQNHIPIVVPLKAYWQIMPDIIKYWGVYYFGTEAEARVAAKAFTKQEAEK